MRFVCITLLLKSVNYVKYSADGILKVRLLAAQRCEARRYAMSESVCLSVRLYVTLANHV